MKLLTHSSSCRHLRISHFVLGAAFAAALLTAEAFSSDLPLRPYTVDDYLALEAVGASAGQSNRIVWEQAPPYEQIGYFGLGHVGTWGNFGFTLQTINLSDDDPKARPLFAAESGVSYGIDAFSPNARFISFFGAKNGMFFMGAYDTEERRKQIFEGAPNVSWSWRAGVDSVWISSEEFAFAALEEGGQPPAAARPFTGKKLEEAWKRSWSGGLSVDISNSALGSGESDWLAGRLYLANARTGHQRLLAEGKYVCLKVSPDGAYLAALRQAKLFTLDPLNAFVRARSQLVVFDLRAGGPVRVVAPDKDVFPETLAWASDGNRLAFFAWNVGDSAQSGIYYAFDAVSGTVTPFPHRGLDLASERERGLHQKPERVMWVDDRLALLARSYGGTEPRFTYRSVSRPGMSDYPGKADWFLLDAQGRSENLTEQFKAISPIPIHGDSNTITVLADGAAWRVGPNREATNLTAEMADALFHPQTVLWSTRHLPFGAVAILESHDADRPAFMLLDLKTGAVRRIESPVADASVLAVLPASGAALYRYDHVNGMELILKYADGRQVVIDQLNKHLAHVAKTKWITISYKVMSHVGERTLEANVLLPADYRSGQRYPVIVEVYPNRGAINPTTLEHWEGLGRMPGPYSEHLLAGKGYIVFRPNTLREVTNTKDGPIGGMTDMVHQGLDALVAQGYADPKRIGLLGFSQGGFSSLWVASQSQRFRAVVSLNGWADMYIQYTDSNYLRKFYKDETGGFQGWESRYLAKAGSDFPIGRKPYDDPDVYIRNSPRFRAPDFTSPVLLIHSDMDVFDLRQYEHMFTALNQLEKPARLLRYWGEGHSLSSPANIRHMWTEIFEWYDRYLTKTEE